MFRGETMIPVLVQVPESVHARLLELAHVHTAGDVPAMIVLLMQRETAPVDFEQAISAFRERSELLQAVGQ